MFYLFRLYSHPANTIEPRLDTCPWFLALTRNFDFLLKSLVLITLQDEGRRGNFGQQRWAGRERDQIKATDGVQ